MPPSLSDIGEFGFIDRIRKTINDPADVVVGIGDDCAVIRVGDSLMAVTCDMCIENVHFRRVHASMQNIGWKAAASAISDLAAMGAVPAFGLVAAACPKSLTVEEGDALVEGIRSCFDSCGATIIGGDTTAAEQLTIDITAMGHITNGRYLTRTGAHAGDVAVVTGYPGRSAAGLHALENNHDAPTLRELHYRPVPRVQEGHWLAQHQGVHAAIDISDGLAQDAGHIVEASGVGLRLQRESILIADDLRAYSQQHKLDPLAFAMNGGEDYELLLAVDVANSEEIVDTFKQQFETPIHIIGQFTDEEKDILLDGEPFARTGFQHFKVQE